MSKTTNAKTDSESKSIVQNQDKEVTQVTMDGTKIGTSTRPYAQLLDFAALQNILTQNVSKTQTKTYVQYTKEKLITYIQSPLANIDNIRDVSQYLYRISSNYRTLINYYANMPLYSYNVIYKNDNWTKKLTSKTFMADYQTVCARLQNMNLKSLSPKIVATCLRDGIYCGFTYDDENSFFINDLDPKYYKISGITENNTYIVKFNAAYFDSGSNKDFLYGINEDGEGTWDKVFVQGYEDYKNNGRDFQWFELPPERTICMICGEDPIVPLPFFLPVFQSLLDLMDYQDLIRSKTELENYVLLLSKIPLISGSEEVNDFAVDLDLVRLSQQMIDEVAPELCATAFSPCEVEPIFFNNKNQVDDTNAYSKAIKNLFESLGISSALFGDSDNSIGLRHSIRVDESLMFYQMSKLEANIKRYIKLNISENFDFYYHKVTVFSQDEYTTSLKDYATLGIKRLDYATVSSTPFEVMNSTFMENAIGINEMWQPLNTSYVQSGNDNKGGGQTKKDDELSPEGISSRDNNKNEGTKANG